METVLEHKTFTFREVHAELEMENSLLLKEHNLIHNQTNEKIYSLSR